ARNVLTLRFAIPGGMLGRDSLPAFYTELVDRLRAVPGVTHAALGSCAPLHGGCNHTGIGLKDRPPVEGGKEPRIAVHWATPDLFAALRIPLKRGRSLATTDRVGTPNVVLVNETAARRFWP